MAEPCRRPRQVSPWAASRHVPTAAAPGGRRGSTLPTPRQQRGSDVAEFTMSMEYPEKDHENLYMDLVGLYGFIWI